MRCTLIENHHAIAFRNIQVQTNGDLSQKLAEFTVTQNCQFFNLKYMELDGVSLEIDRVEFQDSMLSISARVYVSEIPA
ncbi:hypothetical protein AY599_21865 [Leptolyngbya valderiana BDU 20041]|nr:hypothetical protein [Geitlerinema sp. CS-897]OAB63668.1 hypothetical protein AY599_21865 [Leptolyngbya valderiana BDU 20041]PPT09665.1 hypothetical protein CKA32_001061 [Geitlerinema sp. FC II]